jgi:hypothetical protein
MTGIAGSIKSKSMLMEKPTSKLIKKNVLELQNSLQIAGKLGNQLKI